MRTLIKSLLILISISCFGQTKSDYQEYLKEKIEAGAPLDNYKYLLLFGNTGLLKVDAETFVGKYLTQEEYERMMFFGTEIYFTDKRNRLFLEVIRSCDLKGVRKVGVTKSIQNGKTFFKLTLYVRNGYICSEFSDPKEPVKSIDKISININCDKTTANNIKKGIIKLAQLNGAIDVFDADDLFND